MATLLHYSDEVSNIVPLVHQYKIERFFKKNKNTELLLFALVSLFFIHRINAWLVSMFSIRQVLKGNLISFQINISEYVPLINMFQCHHLSIRWYSFFFKHLSRTADEI